jgi:hypothetical protein
MRSEDKFAHMSARWMPRCWWPKKDAPTRRNALGRRWEPVSQRSPNGATRPGSYPGTQAYAWEGTGGTETSQYPEEEKGFPQ